MKSEIHKLLYRLAEIMLQQEQHVLPVDLLFDDAQIGDFVKSIQIDSPYQQLLLEGVLTESVREEKLYVSFTVEGYFHYVLGEVIFIQTEGKGPESLNFILEKNRLKGVKEGVEQCLIRDVKKDDLTRLIWLIDRKNDLSDLFSLPLAFSFLNVKGQIKTEIDHTYAYNVQITLILNELLNEPSDNDIKTLIATINHLENAQKNEVVVLLYRQINGVIIPDSLNKSILFVKSIEHIIEADQTKKLQDVIKIEILDENDLAVYFYHSLGHQFIFKNDFDKAIEYFEKSLAMSLKVHGEDQPSIGDLYGELGMVFSYKSDYNKAIEYFEKSLAIRLKVHGTQHSSIGESYLNLGSVWRDKGDYDKAIEYNEKSVAIRLKVHGTQHPLTGKSFNNLGWIWTFKGDYDKAILYLEKSLDIRLRVYGEQHPSTGESYSNLGLAWSEKSDYDKAIVYLVKSLEINRKVHGEYHESTGTTNANIGNVYRVKKDLINAKVFYEKAYAIFFNSLGEKHPETKLAKKKIKEINDA
jgi:tetratricopeptide (TPR) repeat protein